MDHAPQLSQERTVNWEEHLFLKHPRKQSPSLLQQVSVNASSFYSTNFRCHGQSWVDRMLSSVKPNDMSHLNPKTVILFGIPFWIGFSFFVVFLVALLGNLILLINLPSEGSLYQPVDTFQTVLTATDIGLCAAIAPKFWPSFGQGLFHGLWCLPSCPTPCSGWNLIIYWQWLLNVMLTSAILWGTPLSLHLQFWVTL